MKIFSKLIFILILMGAFSANAFADTPKILLMKDLKPGTKAVGFSVFSGVEPQSFDVVLGKIINKMGNDFILVRISGGLMDTPLERIGAIGGMSGSPMFIGCGGKDVPYENKLDDCTKNGTLVGALSYGIGSFIEGGMNALITPAEYMLGAKTSGYLAAAQFLTRMPDKIYVEGKEFINLMLFPKMEKMQVAGNSEGQCKDSPKSDIKPGSMVSVFLATGTINIAASGTVTWRDEDKIYIFGHPLMGTGMVQYPFVQVSVADTLQTPSGAHKMIGCYLETKGAMFVDGAFEMAGTIGATASMLPYRVELYMGNGGAILSEEIAASPLASEIIKELPIVWASSWLGDLSRFSLVYQTRITLKNEPEIFVKNMIPAQTSKNPFRDVFVGVYGPFEKLRASGFNYGVESIKVRLEIIKDFELWQVKKVFLSQEKAVPGETVYANVVLEEYFSFATKQMSIPIKVPEDFMERVEPGDLPEITILIQGGSKFTDKRQQPEVASVEGFIKQLNQSMNHRIDTLYIQQIMPRSKAENETDKVNAKASVKPPLEWTDIGESDLKRLPRNEKIDVVLTLSPTLSGFIDFNQMLNLTVQEKEEVVMDKKEVKKRKLFWPFK